MAYISYSKLWESEFDGIVSKRDKLQDLNIIQLKLEVHDTYEKDEKITTNFEPIDNSDVVNKGYLDSKLIKINGHLSKLEKDYSEFKLQHNKQNVEEFLVQRAVKTTIQILYDKGLFDNFQNAEEVLKDFLFTTRRRPDLEKKMMMFNDFIKQYKLKNKATSNLKNQQILSSLSLNDVGIYLRDGPFISDIGVVNLHPSKGTHWVCYINKSYFDSYGCSPPKKLGKFIIKRNGHCLYSKYQIQKKNRFCASFCLYKIYLTKVLGIDFKSAVLNLYYQRFSSN